MLLRLSVFTSLRHETDNLAAMCKYSLPPSSTSTLSVSFASLASYSRRTPYPVDYLPVYYQACKDASPIASGVDLLGLCFSTGPFSIIIGISVKVTKQYRPQLWLAWCLMLIGMGLTSTVTEDTSRAASIGYQIVVGVGIGIVYSAAYFPVLAPLSVTLNAAALAFFVFLRSFAQVRDLSA